MNGREPDCESCGDSGVLLDLDPCGCPPGRVLAAKNRRETQERRLEAAARLLRAEGYTVEAPK